MILGEWNGPGQRIKILSFLLTPELLKPTNPGNHSLIDAIGISVLFPTLRWDGLVDRASSKVGETSTRVQACGGGSFHYESYLCKQDCLDLCFLKLDVRFGFSLSTFFSFFCPSAQLLEGTAHKPCDKARAFQLIRRTGVDSAVEAG